MVTNQMAMIGPNSKPTLLVPSRWPLNRMNRMTKLIATVAWLIAGAATVKPSTALKTVIAGVMMPSP